MKGIKISLKVPAADVVEYLSRAGISSREEKKLVPSCYLTKEEDGYYICHFKELLRIPSADSSDLMRRDTIIYRLIKYGYISTDEPVNQQKKKIFILTREQRDSGGWTIVHKYHVNKDKIIPEVE